MKGERLVPKNGKTNFSMHLKQFDVLARPTDRDPLILRQI